MPDQPALLSDPDPPLTDGTVVLRRWAESDIGCVEEASRDPRIPEGTTVPARVHSRRAGLEPRAFLGAIQALSQLRL